MIDRENFKIQELKSGLSCKVKIVFIEKTKFNFIQHDVSEKYPEISTMLNSLYHSYYKLPKVGEVLKEGKQSLKIISKNSDDKSINFVCEII